MDALITATARVIDIPVLTRNKKLAQLLGHETAFDLYAYLLHTSEVLAYASKPLRCAN